MNFKEIMDIAYLEAISSKLQPTEESEWRKICRYYSEHFHVKLPDVLSMDPYHVLLNYFEDTLKDIEVEENLDKILDIVYSIEDPSYDQKKEEELDQFIKQLEEKNKKQVQKNEGKEEKPTNLPTEGYINLSYLEEHDSKEIGEPL